MSTDAEWRATYARLLVQRRLVAPEALQSLARLCAARGEDLRSHLLARGLVRPEDDARLLSLLQEEARVPTTDPGSRSGRATRNLPVRMPSAGDVFAGYVIQSEIARGGAGAVYVALAPSGARVALKVLLHDVSQGARRERFLREVEIGTALKHPGVVQVLDHGEADGRPYLVMELLENATPLDRYVDLHEPAILERARLVMEVAQAVHAAHQSGIIHRDLKPDNVLVTEDGQVKVVDFGIARQLDRERLTQSGAVMGTLHYMPPEQVRGQSAHVDARADVYSLGVMLYRLISGELPYDGETSVQVMSAILDHPVPDLRARVPDVPPGLPEVVRVAMAKSPEHRYDTAGEFAQDLAAVSSGSDTAASTRLRHIPEPKRGRLIALLFVLAVALGAGLAASWLGRRPDLKELQRRAGPIYDDAWRLLGASAAPLSADAEQIEGLLGRMRELDALASEPDSQMALDRPRRRLRALEGLLALSRGDRDAARSCGYPNDNPSPVEGALLGGLAATDPEGDAERAARLLSQALARGIKRPELHLWRAMAWSRSGYSGNQAELALADLDVVRRASGGSLDFEGSCLRARALVATQRPDEARALIAAFAEPAPQSLRWEIALAGVALKFETDALSAREFMNDLPTQSPPDPRRTVLAKKVERVALRLMRNLGYTPTSADQEQQLIAWAQLSRRLDPAAPSPELISALLAESTGLKADNGLIDLGLALAELVPDNRSVQTEIARLVGRNHTNYAIAIRFLSTLRRAIVLETDARERSVLRSLLLAVLGRSLLSGHAAEGDYTEAVQLSENLLAIADDRSERGEILWRRGQVHLSQGSSEAALRDANGAVDINEKDARYLQLQADALWALDRRDRCLSVAVRLGKMASGTLVETETMMLLWTLGRAGLDPARVSEGLAPLLAPQAKNPGWWIRLAWLQLKGGQRDAASSSLQRANAQMPKAGDVAELRPRLEELRAAVTAQDPDAQAKANGLVDALEALRGDSLRP